VYGPGQHFPGFKIFSGFSIGGNYNHSVLVNYGPSIAVYTKSLGANLNPLVGDIQVDFTNSFSIGACWGGNLAWQKYFRTIGNASFYNIATNQENALLLSTNLLLNNHHRNQSVGAISFSTKYITVNYYNDGAVPFNLLPLADNFDRWWTGGFGIYLHNRQNYNTAELSFDQFTGYSPLLYELSNILGINIPAYDLSRDSASNRRLPPSYNTSAYNLKIYPIAGYGIDAGIMGNLKFGKAGRVAGLQDIIHTMLHYSLHPNNDPNRFYMGATLNQFNDIHIRQ
jgi:hypothetical protein